MITMVNGYAAEPLARWVFEVLLMQGVGVAVLAWGRRRG